MGYWVSAGREIENYLSSEVLTNFAKEEVKKEQFGKIYNKDKNKGFCEKYKDKVKNSREIVDLMKDYELETEENYDLGLKINELIETIRAWNSI